VAYLLFYLEKIKKQKILLKSSAIF